jgi:hypothetical protein
MRGGFGSFVGSSSRNEGDRIAFQNDGIYVKSGGEIVVVAGRNTPIPLSSLEIH